MKRHYFLGGNTTKGFYSYYDYLLGPKEANKIYAIKGGPGTGKSTLMKKVARWADGRDYDIDYLHCSSDPDSLDGVIVRDIGIAMVDGTSPHIVDPINPGCVDTILHMGEFWNEKDNIIACNTDIKRYFTRAYHYIGAAGEFYRDIMEINQGCLSEAAVLDAASKLTAGKSKISGRIGTVRKLFLTAISPLGVIGFPNSFAYPAVYVLKARIAGGSGRVLEKTARYFTENGYDIECFYDPLSPQDNILHMTVPQEGIFITTDDFFTKYPTGNTGTVIDLDAMLDSAAVQRAETDLQESRELVNTMVDRAVTVIKKAKSTHDQLEQNYVPYMDFERINLFQEQVLRDIERFI